MGQYISNLVAELHNHVDENGFHLLAHESALEEYSTISVDAQRITIGEWLRTPVLNVFWHQFALPFICSRLSFDVLFLPAASRRTPIMAPCPTVGTVHDLTPFHVAGKYDHSRMFYQTRILPMLLKRLTRIIAVSESTKRDLIEFAGIPEERITVVYHAADPILFHPRNRSDALERMRGYGVRSPYIVYTSRIEHPGKNHLRLIHAFEILKAKEAIPHQLVLAGADWTRAEEVHKAASESPVRDDILFTGYVSSRDLPELYCGADMLVFPSLFEGFGIPILEAMSCGVPVACSNTSSMPEIAGDAAALFDPLDPNSIAHGVLGVLSSADARKRMAQKGLQRAELFTWREAASRTLDVIRDAAET